MLSHRNSYSAGSASAAYGFRSAAPTQPTRTTSTSSVREGHSAEYEVLNTIPRSRQLIAGPMADICSRLG